MSLPSYTYNAGVPNPDNDPSVDQPDMLINTQSIASLIATDHVGFNTPNGGTHDQVTFSSNNVPTLPTTFPTLFTQVPSGGTKPELYFYSGTAAQSSSQYVRASAGSAVLTAGIIIKWGSSGLVPNNTTINFVSPFPNACFNVQLTIQDATQKQAFLNVSSQTTTGFTIRTINSNGSATSTAFEYFAIGF